MKAIDFEDAFSSGIFDDEYMEFIHLNADPTVFPIYNGDSLIDAFEKGYLFEEFRASKIGG
jgi:hypothetical protein